MINNPPLFFFKKLPNTNKKYNDVSELEEAITKVCNNDEELINRSKRMGIKIVGCSINRLSEESPKLPNGNRAVIGYQKPIEKIEK